MKNFNFRTLLIGFSMFSMFFGAGNVIFPLVAGQYAGDKNLFAILGLILTAVVVPIGGVISMVLFNGDYKKFFGRLGEIPGFLLALTTISLLGPLGSTPRCIALSYSTVKSSFPAFSPVIFSALGCVIIYLFTFKKNYILTLLGWILTPLLLGSLFAIIVLGIFTSHEMHPVAHSNRHLFLYGLKEGYNTMDLLASFFFSSTILNLLNTYMKKESSTDKNSISVTLWASLIGGFLLSITYIGFSYVSSFHGANLTLTGQDELLAVLTKKIAGPSGGLLVCITIALACLTTAIALISSFADFIQKEVFREKIGYQTILCGSLLLTFFVSTFEFTGISSFLGPILQICYPGLIVLTIGNLIYHLKNQMSIKWPVFSTFALSVLLFFAS